MSNPIHRRRDRIRPLAALVALSILFPVFDAAASNEREAQSRSTPDDRLVVALASPNTALQNTRSRADRYEQLTHQLVETRLVLEELRRFVDDAEAAIQLSERLKTVRAANLRLKQDLQNARANRNDLKRAGDPAHGTVRRLTRMIVTNWLASGLVDARTKIGAERLALAEMSLLDTEHLALSMRRRLAARRADLQNLRAQIAALAAEIGQTRRQIDVVTAEHRLLERDRLIVQARMQALRGLIAARLQAILKETAAH